MLESTPESAPAAEPEPASASQPVPVPSKHLRVLIVEDVATTRSLLRKILTDAGYQVTEAVSGEAAIKAYHETKPDVVTMDVFLEKLSGIGALQVILRLDPDARVVMCSSQTDLGFIHETKRLGARGYLRKPFEPEAVREAIAAALA